MADYVASTGVKLKVDTTELTQFGKSAEELEKSLTKAQKAMGLTYNADKLLTNKFGQVVQGLSMAQIKMGNYVDELGRVRTYQGGFVDGLTSTQKALGWYADELGNVYDRLGNLVKATQQAQQAIESQEKVSQQAGVSSAQWAQGVVGITASVNAMASSFSSASPEIQGATELVAGFINGFSQVGAIFQSIQSLLAMFGSVTVASESMAAAGAIENVSLAGATDNVAKYQAELATLNSTLSVTANNQNTLSVATQRLSGDLDYTTEIIVYHNQAMERSAVLIAGVTELVNKYALTVEKYNGYLVDANTAEKASLATKMNLLTTNRSLVVATDALNTSVVATAGTSLALSNAQNNIANKAVTAKTAVDQITASYAKYKLASGEIANAGKVLNILRHKMIPVLLALNEAELESISTDIKSKEAQEALAKAGVNTVGMRESMLRAISREAREAGDLLKTYKAEAWFENYESAREISKTEGYKKLSNERRKMFDDERIARRRMAIQRATSVKEINREIDIIAKRTTMLRNQIATEEANLAVYPKSTAVKERLVRAQEQLAAFTELSNEATARQTTLTKLQTSALAKYAAGLKAAGSSMLGFIKNNLSLNKVMMAAMVGGGVWYALKSSIDKNLGSLKQAQEEFRNLANEARLLGKAIDGVSNYRTFKQVSETFDVDREIDKLYQNYDKHMEEWKNKELTASGKFWEFTEKYFLNPALGLGSKILGVETPSFYRQYLGNKAYNAEISQATQRLAERTQMYLEELKTIIYTDTQAQEAKIAELEKLYYSNFDERTRENLGKALEVAREGLVNAAITTENKQLELQDSIKQVRLDYSGLSNYVQKRIKAGDVDARAFDLTNKKMKEALDKGWITQEEYVKAVNGYTVDVEKSHVQKLGADSAYLNVLDSLIKSYRETVDAKKGGYDTSNDEFLRNRSIKNLVNGYLGLTDAVMESENETLKYTNLITVAKGALSRHVIEQVQYNDILKATAKAAKLSLLEKAGVDTSYITSVESYKGTLTELKNCAEAGIVSNEDYNDIFKATIKTAKRSLLEKAGVDTSYITSVESYKAVLKELEGYAEAGILSNEEYNDTLAKVSRAFKGTILDEIGVEWESKNKKHLIVLAKLTKALDEQVITQEEFNNLQKQNMEYARRGLQERLGLLEKTNLFETIPEKELREWGETQRELNIKIKDLDQSLKDGIINQNEYNKAVDTLKNKISMDAALDLGWQELKDATYRPRTAFEKLDIQLESYRRALQRGEIDQKTFDDAEKRINKRIEQEKYAWWKSWKDKYRGELGIDSLIDENRSAMSKYKETIWKITGSLKQGYITVQEANMLGVKAYGDLYENLNNGFGGMLTKTVSSFERGSESLYQQQIKQRDGWRDNIRGHFSRTVNYLRSMQADTAYMRRLQEEREEYQYETWGQYL